MNHIHSYPSVFQLGHRAIQDIFKGPVIIEEKVDGSQISFGLIDGEVCVRSKGKDQLLDAPDKMFNQAIEVIKSLQLTPGYIYRGEYLQKPKHNTLVYSRIPNRNIIIYDIQDAAEGSEIYLSPADKEREAELIGLECVPILWEGLVEDFEKFKSFLDRESILGGCKVEGVVIKNYNVFTMEKKVAMGKYVSETFKEVHSVDWKSRNPTSKDIASLITEQYATEARWQKAVQHLKEAGLLKGDTTDIALLIREVPTDILKECKDEIMKTLFDHFWKKNQKYFVRGLAEWYKNKMAQEAFNDHKD